VFVSLLPPELPRWAALLLPLAVFCIEAGWYSIMALLGLKLILTRPEA
jgi:hypothetical protein